MQVYFSQAGYHPLSDKTALVAVDESVRGGRFAAIQDGREVLRGELKPCLGHAVTPSPRLLLAEFSRVRSTGWNELQVTLSDGTFARTPAFRISPMTYRGMAKETLLWFGPQRCGTRAEFWHEACHCADLAVGGWHSGDSWDQRADAACLGVWACAELDALVRDRTTIPGEPYPHIVAEAAWGGQWLLRLQGEDSRFASGISRHETGGRRARAEDDAAPGELGAPLNVPTCALIGFALCQLSLRVRPHDRTFANRCLESAAQVWRKHRATEPTSQSALKWSAAFALLDLGLCCAIAARKQTVELNLPDTEPARDDLTRRMEVVIRANPSSDRQGAEAFYVLLSLLEFLDKFPEHELRPSARGEAERLIGIMKSTAQQSTFSLTEMVCAGNEAILTAAFLLARAATVLGRFDLLALAERHAQWVWGRNPFGVSMMCGVGADASGRSGPQTGLRGLGVWFTPNAVYAGHRDGYQLGGVVRGISPDANGQPTLDLRTLDDERERLGLDCNATTNAYSLPATAWMMLNCSAIDVALTRLHP